MLVKDNEPKSTALKQRSTRCNFAQLWAFSQQFQKYGTNRENSLIITVQTRLFMLLLLPFLIVFFLDHFFALHFQSVELNEFIDFNLS